jgi:hypothetical protein
MFTCTHIHVHEPVCSSNVCATPSVVKLHSMSLNVIACVFIGGYQQGLKFPKETGKLDKNEVCTSFIQDKKCLQTKLNVFLNICIDHNILRDFRELSKYFNTSLKLTSLNFRILRCYAAHFSHRRIDYYSE